MARREQRAAYRVRRLRPRGTLILVLAPMLALALGGCDRIDDVLHRFLLKTDEIIVEQRPDPVYEQLFPYYVELCALSQWDRKAGGRGNPFGHAVMYLKGACKDETAPYPQLRRCRTVATSFDDPEHGVGVSVGRWFRNVNWVATPGYHLFYTGNLAPGERLTQAHFDATVREAVDRGVFDGVELHPEWTAKATWTLEDFVADQSIATDFALRFSRNVFCARLPVTEPVLDEVIAFLNDKNHEYAAGKASYNWNLLANNCVHTVRNALAAAHVWTPLSVRRVKLMHLLNLAVPANEFVNLAILGAEGPFSDDRELHRDDSARAALLDFRWLPTRHGALVKTMPVHAPNDLYDTTFRLFAVQSPLRMGKTNAAVRLLADGRYVDLEQNLRTFGTLYEAILQRHDDPADPFASVRGTPLRRIGRLHRDYAGAQRDEVAALLDRLAALGAASEQR
ncbi:MAG: hypothetical protein ACFCUO_12760 [Rhodospirillales bacterium]